MKECLDCLFLGDCYKLASLESFEKNEGIEAIIIKCNSFKKKKGDACIG